MPYSKEPSVIHWNGCDYWRTWFLEECEKYELFGVTKKHTGLIESYNIGTLLYLEDAPYFKDNKHYHRVCGPYEVYAIATLPDDSEPFLTKDGNIIVYLDNNPSRGPWHNRSHVQRLVDGHTIKFKQIASEFNYFPYRFGIRKHKRYDIRLIPHNSSDCWLCK